MSIEKKLRWKSHVNHSNLLAEFYYYNKYILTEQMKDALLDAVECMDYVEEMKASEPPKEAK